MNRLKQFSAALTVALATVGCANSNSYTIKGTISSSDEVRYDSAFVMVGDVRNAVAITDNQFVLTGKVDTPILTEIQIVYVDPENGVAQGTLGMPVVIEPGVINVSLEDYAFEIGGTPQNDAIKRYVDAAKELNEAQGEWEELETLVKEFIADNSQTQVGVYAILVGQNILTEEDLMEALKGCSESVMQHSDVAKIVERMKILERTSEGKSFVDFEVPTDNGVVKLSDYVGKGNVVLIDFWASWCGPCRAEIPNVKAVYDEFKSKGLVVVGVPTSDRPEDTRRAIEQDNIPFTQIIGSERQAIGAKAYGVRGIPCLVLFDSDGTILGRGHNIEGLRETLVEALK